MSSSTSKGPGPSGTFILGLVMKRRYNKNGANISAEEKARIEGIDAALEALDDPSWSTWPTLSEVIADGRYGTEAEMRSKNTGIAWSDTLSETEECYKILPVVQEIIRTHYPLNKKYEVGLIKRHPPDTRKSPDNEIFPLVHWLGDKDGDIPIMQKYKFTGGRIDSSLVPPPASLPDEDGELYRHMLFPITKYDWLHQLSEFCEQTSGFNELYRQKPDIGFYNDFLKPHIECSPRVGKPTHVFVSLPIISIKPGQKFRNQKSAERFIRYTPAPLRAPGYHSFYQFINANGEKEYKRPIYRWTNALDSDMYVQNITGAPTVYSSRSLFEYKHPRRRTEHLDDRQTIRKADTRFGNSADQDRYICVDQMWSVIIPKSETLVTFQELIEPQKVLERAYSNNYDLEESRRLEIPPCGPVHECMLFFGGLALRTQYEIINIFRDAAADIIFRVSSNPVGDESLIQDCNFLLAELSIIIEITNSQLDVLAGINNILIDENVIRKDEFVAATKFYTQLTDRLKVVAGIFKGYQEDGKQAQNLLFQLLNTENAKQQAMVSTKQVETAEQTAKETVIQVRMAEKAEEQSKSVLVFTIITTVFLPLSFFTSYYGMDATSAGISDANAFWRISGPASVMIIVLAMALAFRSKIKRALGLGKRPEGTDGVDGVQGDPEKGLIKRPKKTPTFFLYPRGQKVD